MTGADSSKIYLLCDNFKEQRRTFSLATQLLVRLGLGGNCPILFGPQLDLCASQMWRSARALISSATFYNCNLRPEIKIKLSLSYAQI